MEDMKLLKVIIATISFCLLANCTATVNTISNQPMEQNGQLAKMPFPKTLGEKELSATGMVWNGVQYLRFNLNKSEKTLHKQAVYHTLNNAQIGEITAWHSNKRLATGKVRVVHQYPTSSGYCRVYQSYIQLNGANRHMTNKACKSYTYPWVFLK